ncbi:GntR family transcriptional regulator [Phenylobacterium montanum]|uniref:GntR family transcriptional regulator n=1 Tax=Phenylobacterium montanum TaxID=2823693 RepID=A0A975IYR4_9CAUL|nr:GntR family transcriptional regulator [Caulobacter sp. S6]
MGASAANTKAACVIAAQTEEDLIGRGWPTGIIYGSETQLATRFGVCRVVMREAVRILESRGTAQMRRGPNGGLLVLAPTMPVVLEAIHRYIMSRFRELHQGSACRTILHTVHARLTGPGSETCEGPGLIDFLEVLISAVDQFAREGPAGHVLQSAAAKSARSRAAQVLRLLMKDLHGRDATDHRLGSEFDLCDRYSADRNAMRQAVRVLEFEGIAESLAGRGKGLMVRTPEPSALCRLIICYFTATRVTPGDATHLFKMLSAEVVSMAAEQATDSQLGRLGDIQRLLESDARVTTKVIQQAEESLFGFIDEPLIDILLRCTGSYSIWWSSIDPESEQGRSVYRTTTLKVVSALLARDGVAAAVAQAHKVECLNRLT